MAEMLHISSKAAREALQKLIDELDGADLSMLAEAVARKPKRVQEVSQWKQALRTTIRDIEEWCPSGSFTIDAEPRR